MLDARRQILHIHRRTAKNRVGNVAGVATNLRRFAARSKEQRQPQGGAYEPRDVCYLMQGHNFDSIASVYRSDRYHRTQQVLRNGTIDSITFFARHRIHSPNVTTGTTRVKRLSQASLLAKVKCSKRRLQIVDTPALRKRVCSRATGLRSKKLFAANLAAQCSPAMTFHVREVEQSRPIASSPFDS